MSDRSDSRPNPLLVKQNKKKSHFLCVLLIDLCIVSATVAFVYPPTNQHHIITQLHLSSTPPQSSSPFSKIKFPNPFSSSSDTAISSNDNSPTDTIPTSPGSYSTITLFDRARAVISADFADPFLLDDNFIWISPELYGRGLNKEDYIAARQFFDLRGTFPDLDYRAHDFRLDPEDPYTVRVTLRVVGTMRGDLRLRKEVLPANGKRMVCPPEAVTMTFAADTLKLQKLTSGFTMDRLVGNTEGLCGIPAAATIAGSPPSVWDRLPPVTVVQRFFARPTKQIGEPESFLAPFPESVMIQLAKGVLAADNGASDPSLLSEGFMFTGPLVGPVGKNEFVKAFGGFKIKEAFPDLDASYTNFRVDPFDPYRVWLDAKGRGTDTGGLAGNEPTGKSFESPPEAVSLTFDEEGICTRLTAGAVMDPSKGNTGGLGGVFGIFYAIGKPLPGIVSRSFPENFARLQKQLLQPITKLGVDDYGIPPPSEKKPSSSGSQSTIMEPRPPPLPPKAETTEKSDASPTTPKIDIPKLEVPKIEVPKIEVPKIEVPKIEIPSLSTQTKDEPQKIPKPPKTKPPTINVKKAEKIESKPKDDEKAEKERLLEIGRTELAKRRQEEKEERKRQQLEKQAAATAAAKAKREQNQAAIAARKAAAAAAAATATTPTAEDTKEQRRAKAAADVAQLKAAAEKEKKETQAAIRAKQDRAAEKFKNSPFSNPFAASSSSTSSSRDAAETARQKKEQAVAAAQQKRLAAEQKRKEAEAKKRSVKENDKSGDFVEILRSRTLRLFAAPQKSGGTAPVTPKANPPKGVPVLSKWKKNRNGTVTGSIFGSGMFEEGEQVTTSPIAGGDFVSGSVIRTQSGSKYFLE